MTSHRLPRHVVPERYDLRLAPDLARASFTGHVAIAITVLEPAAEILLNAVELEIAGARARPDGAAPPEAREAWQAPTPAGGGPLAPEQHVARGSPPPRGAELKAREAIELTAKVAVEADLERIRLTLPRALSTGAWRLELEFRGTLNDHLRGFYRSTWRDAAGATRVLAATQFEATDARRAFPCWDEPDRKAVFAVTLELDPRLTAVSNTRIRSERLEGGRKVVAFADTIRMSTYLVAVVVGELEAGEPERVGPTEVRIWSVPGKRPLGAFARDAAAFTLGFFERYYGLPYPGDKLDLLAIPDFASGAMENLGAITFRETLLLVDAAAASHGELERVADVVAHENAHMWFGDLATMRWWNGLWLNEAFATFMEMLAVDAWRPGWDRWTAFGASRAAAFAVDALWSTRPIEFPVDAPREADAMFDVLTYEKGASVLRMLEQYLGPDVFRDGVRDYLRTHAYGNADTGDLWAALGRASGLPIGEVMDAWVFRPGFPLVEARVDSGRLVLSQQRFTYLPEPPESGDAGADVPWQVPVRVRVAGAAGSAVERLLLGGESVSLELPAGFAYALVNEGGHGFYRVTYAPELADRLLARLDGGLAPIERFCLVSDAWAATLAGARPAAGFLELLLRFRGERDVNVWTAIAGALRTLARVVREADRPRLAAFHRALVGPVVAELGWAPRSGDSELVRQLRGDLLGDLGVLGDDPGTQAAAVEIHARALADPASVDPAVAAAVLRVLAHTGDAARYAAFQSRYAAAATPQEEQRYLFATTGFRPVELVARTLERLLDGDVRAQDAPYVARALLGLPHARARAWAWVTEHWDAMEARWSKHALRRMSEGVTGLATPALEREVRQFFAERRVDFGGRTLAQYLEQLRVQVALHERESGGLGAALDAAAARLGNGATGRPGERAR